MPAENVRKTIDHITDWIKRYFIRNYPEGKAVIGISGGKDSTVAAALLCRALGPDRVIAVMMPNGEQADIDDSYEVCEELKIPDENRYVINIRNIVDACYDCVHESKTNFNIVTNTPPRIRMTVLYMIAAQVGGLVCNTSNKSEIFIGYSTKYGDSAGDFALLKNYTASDVITLGCYMDELPMALVKKPPSDGLCGSTDEERLGFTYEELDNYIKFDIMPEYEKANRIIKMHQASEHKKCINLPAPDNILRYNHWSNSDYYPKEEDVSDISF
jgi:NAD+ synthase